MRPTTKPRGERLRATVPGPAEIQRLARWYEGIADDYAAAILPTGAHPGSGELRRQERDARHMAALLRAKVAHL